jgi:hypothetical protein
MRKTTGRAARYWISQLGCLIACCSRASATMAAWSAPAKCCTVPRARQTGHVQSVWPAAVVSCRLGGCGWRRRAFVTPDDDRLVRLFVVLIGTPSIPCGTTGFSIPTAAQVFRHGKLRATGCCPA